MIKENISLKNYTNYKIGGPARYFLEAHTPNELISGMKEWRKTASALPENARKRFILGGGTNVLVDDRGYNGLIILNNLKFKKREGNKVAFGSGLPFSDAINFCIENSLSGLEWAGGLPGTVGGAVRGNAGAFGGEMKDTVVSVESINLDSARKTIWNNTGCDFGYRHSVFKTDKANDELITAVTFELSPGIRSEIARVAQEKIDYRRSRQPLEYPSAGSTFKNVDCTKAPPELAQKCASVIKNDPLPVIPVAYLLSESDLKGKRVGGAMISEKHPNFIVNVDNAMAADVLALIKLAQEAVFAKFNVNIELEIMYLEY